MNECSVDAEGTETSVENRTESNSTFLGDPLSTDEEEERRSELAQTSCDKELQQSLNTVSHFNEAAMSRKRPAEDAIPAQWGTRIKLASPSPEPTSGSDTEYEIADAAGEKLKFYFSEDSIEEDKIQDEFINAISSDSLDNALLGDTSEENSTSPTSNSDVDPGLPRNDYLDFEKCLLCKTDKKDISYPYCSSCFTWKKNLFPSRPKRRKKSLQKSETESKKLSETSLQSNKSTSDYVDEKRKDGSVCEGLFEDSGVGSTEPQLSEDTVDGASQPSTSSSTATSTSNSSNSVGSEACRVCFLKPENGLFVHLNIAHRYGCYSCAKEIWYHNGVCPLCRRKVSKVKKLYY